MNREMRRSVLNKRLMHINEMALWPLLWGYGLILLIFDVFDHDYTKTYVSFVANPSMASLEPLAWNTSRLEPVILMPVDWNQSRLPEPAVSMWRLCCPSVTFNNNTNFPYNYHWLQI